MIKKIVVSIAVAGMVLYMLMAFAYPYLRPKNRVCQEVAYLINDTSLTAVIRAHEVEQLLRRNRLYPVGLPLCSVPCQRIEACLLQVPNVEQAACYISQADRVCIAIVGRKPILHVLSNSGKRFYIDKQGVVMPDDNCVAYTPVATGYITEQFAQESLYPLAQYLLSEPFWLAQITQIDVNAKHELTLVTRVGSSRIFLGKPTDVEQKLARVMKFYTTTLNKVGWNKYSKINVEFNNQIICTRK